MRFVIRHQIKRKYILTQHNTIRWWLSGFFTATISFEIIQEGNAVLNVLMREKNHI